MPITSALASLGRIVASSPLFGITPDLGLPPIWMFPASIILLILVGVASLGLAKLYVQVKVMLGRK